MKALSFGEILWDVYPDEKFIGGASLNFAAHFKKCGGDAFMVSAVGSDSLANETIDCVEKMGVDTGFITRNSKETGKCLVTLDDKMIPSYNLLNDVAYDYIDTSKISGKKFDALYFGSLALRGEYNLRSLEALLNNNSFGEILVDINIRPPFYTDDVIRFALGRASIVKISDEELSVVTNACCNEEIKNYKEAAKKLSKVYNNLKLVIITLGEKGSYLYNAEESKEYEESAIKTEVVSTVGAGDSFIASFMRGYLSEEKLEKCLSNAAKLSAFVVSQMGAVPEYKIDDII